VIVDGAPYFEAFPAAGAGPYALDLPAADVWRVSLRFPDGYADLMPDKDYTVADGVVTLVEPAPHESYVNVIYATQRST
jgi:hypothetical protein